MMCCENPALAVCKSPCERFCQSGHLCQKLCSDPCYPCITKVDKVVPKCGHTQNVFCSTEPDAIRCQHACEHKCIEGHKCPYPCCTEPCPPCKILVHKRLPNCKHTHQVPCCVAVNAVECKKPCERSACKLGHACRAFCYEKCPPCEIVVDKTLPKCGHTHALPCSTSTNGFKCLSPCKRKICDVKDHLCPKRCHENCEACVVKVLKTIPRCGHSVYLPCHKNPDKVKCKDECAFIMACGHPCTQHCGADDHSKPENCAVDVEKQLPCQHTAIVSCSTNIYKAECQKLVNVELPCGHKQSLKCFSRFTPGRCAKSVSISLSCGHTEMVACSDAASHRCSHVVERQLPCGHSLPIKCSDDVESHANKCTTKVPILVCDRKHTKTVPCNTSDAYRQRKVKCQEKVTVVCERNKAHKLEVECCNSFETQFCTHRCGAKLTCEHTCADTCGNCTKFTTHLMCLEDIQDIALPCGHESTGYCCGIVYPCAETCEFACEHRECNHSCAKVCTPCKLPCTWKCEHNKCSKTCSELCDRSPCNEPCTILLPCKKHTCSGFCGEPCPKVCFECQPRNFRIAERLAKTKLTKDHRFVLLQPCGHIVEAAYMDNYVNNTKLSAKHLGFSLRPLACPQCDEMILSCPRYNDAIKNYMTAVNDGRSQLNKQPHIQCVPPQNRAAFIGQLRTNHGFRRFVQDILCVARIADKGVLLAEYMQIKSSQFEAKAAQLLRCSKRVNDTLAGWLYNAATSLQPPPKKTSGVKAAPVNIQQWPIEDTMQMKTELVQTYLQAAWEVHCVVSRKPSQSLNVMQVDTGDASGVAACRIVLKKCFSRDVSTLLPRTYAFLKTSAEMYGRLPFSWMTCYAGHVFMKHSDDVGVLCYYCSTKKFLEDEFNETIAPTLSACVPAFSADAPTIDTQAPAEPRTSSAQAPNSKSKRKVIKSKSGGN